MNIEDRVTICMLTYLNDDFTQASTWALRRYYPNVRIIYSDGHPTHPFDPSNIPKSSLVWIPGATAETCRNVSSAMVETPYMVIMDNDAKVISPEALPLCLEVMDNHPDCAVTGYYGIRVTDFTTFTAEVGSTFDRETSLSAFNGIFTLHRVAAYREVGMMPHEPFYPTIPREVWDSPSNIAVAGELRLCTLYLDKGWKVISPRKSLPILHWGYTTAWMKDSKCDNLFDNWWHSNVHHTRKEPL